MSWSVKARGTKEQAKDAVRAQLGANHPEVHALLTTLIDDAGGDHVALEGAGHGSDTGGLLRLTMSSWTHSAAAQKAAA